MGIGKEYQDERHNVGDQADGEARQTIPFARNFLPENAQA